MKQGILLAVMVWYGVAVAQEPTVIQRLKTEKIRGTSAALAADSKVKIMKEAGLNTVVTWSYFLKDCPVGPKKVGEPLFEPVALRQSKAMRNEARLAARHKMVSLPLLWFHQDTVPVLAQKAYRRAVTSSGRECKVTPCPADTVYWDELVKPFFLHLAQIQKEEGAEGGAAVDLEFYAGELIGGFTYGPGTDGCFCDDCFGGFLRQNRIAFRAGLFPASARWEYLVKNRQYQAYLDYISGRVVARTTAIRRAVRAIKSDFIIAVMPGGDGWYFDGLGKGFGTEEMPLLMFSEAEYFSGWSERSAGIRRNIEAKKLPIWLVGGLTVSAYNAEGLGAKIAELTEQCNGYWLYYGETLFSQKPKIVERGFRPSEYALREIPGRYWSAVKKAQTQLRLTPTNSAVINLVNQELFPANAITDGLSIPEPPSAFKGQLGERWETEGIEPEKIPQGFRFDLSRRKNRTFFSWKQTVEVTPKQKYRIRMEIKTEGVSFPENGFEITETYSKNPYFRHWVTPTNGKWKYFERTVTPYNPKVDIRLLASGVTGKISFRNIIFEELREIEITSTKLSVIPDTITLEIGEPVGVEVIHPESGLGYFKLENGNNDLRYLKSLYPNVPMALRISGEIGKDGRKLPVRIIGR